MSQIISHLLRNQQQNTFGALLKFNTIFLPENEEKQDKMENFEVMLDDKKKNGIELNPDDFEKSIIDEFKLKNKS